MDVGMPAAPRFDLVPLRHLIAELDVRPAVEAEVGLLVGSRHRVGVSRDVAVDLSEVGRGGAGGAGAACREESMEEEGRVCW